MHYGLGLTFHIAPSNVPINFAFLQYSEYFRNSSIIGFPANQHSRDYLLQAFRNIIIGNLFTHLRSILVVEYERSDEINAFFLKHAKARIIWGGNETIKVRGFEVPHRSRKLCFQTDIHWRY